MDSTNVPTGIPKWIHRLRDNTPYLMVVISIISAVTFLLLGYNTFLGPVLGAVCGSILALAVKHTAIKYPTEPVDWRLGVTATSGYIAGVIIVYRGVFYRQPLAHYALLGAVCAFIAYQIWLGQPRRHVLPQLIAVAFITYWSSQFVYPNGVIAPDHGFMGISNQIATTGFVPSGATYSVTPGHMIYVGEGILLTGMSNTLTYQFLSVVALLTTVGLVAVLDDAIPGVDRRTALFSALIFATLAFTLRRGFLPEKTNFFKPSILLLLFAIFYVIYQNRYRSELIFCSILCVATLVFGHTYSMAAAMITTGPVWAYHRLTVLLQDLDYPSSVSRGTATGITAIVILSIFGYSLAGGTDILGNVSQLVITVATIFEPTTRGISGSRFSAFSWAVLFFSTAAQALFFTLNVAGVSVAIRQRDWSLDAVIAWVLFGIGFLGFSVFFEAITIPTPRIYMLLGVFGLNIMAAIGLATLAQRLPKNRGGFVAATVFVLVVLSLASPVSSIALSPVADEIPGKWRTQSAADTVQQTWTQSYISDELLETRGTSTDIPLRRTGAKTVTADYTNVSAGMLYEHRAIAERRGVRFGGKSARVGAEIVLFLPLPPEIDSESKVYTNTASSVYLHQNITDTRSPRTRP